MKKLTALILALMLLTASAAFAADYPSRPIETQVGYAAGGASDIIARIVADYLSQELGESVVVQNYAGAGGEIAYTAWPPPARTDIPWATSMPPPPCPSLSTAR